MGKCLCGESEFTADMISDSIEATITEIKIKRGYKIEIEFNENYNQFLEE